MNQTPEENKKPTAQKPPQSPAPQWNPYYRRNPDGTPGGHDRTLRQSAAARETAARSAQYKPGQATPAQNQTPPPARPQNAPQTAPREGQQGLGQPVRKASPAARVKPAGTSEAVPPRKPAQKPAGAPSKDNPSAPGEVRYRRRDDGTMTRVYPHRRAGGTSAKTRRTLIVAVALLLVVGALIIGIVALVRRGPKIEYTYDYDGKHEVVIEGDIAYPDEVPYLNMNYLASIFTMTVSGSYDDMKFSTADGEHVSFIPNSRVAMVNGNRHIMDDMAILRGQEMWVPSDFVTEMFVGIEVTWDHEAHTVKVTRKPVSETDTTPMPLTFVLRPEDARTPVEDDTWADGYTYLTDMTAYRDAIEPANRDAFLILVNKENTLSSTYVPADLVNVKNMREGYNTQTMNETAELALRALYQDMNAAGYTDVGVTSGYRTYKLQELLHDRYVYEEMEARNISYDEADKIVCTYSAYAGQSEHQTGLAVDMYNTPSATDAFADTEVYQWLRDHAHQYGFILRYPEDKTSITGYTFEPWHYRFVGRYHATQMYEQGLCLEEYLESLDR